MSTQRIFAGATCREAALLLLILRFRFLDLSKDFRILLPEAGTTMETIGS